jgi:hypothetical protein
MTSKDGNASPGVLSFAYSVSFVLSHKLDHVSNQLRGTEKMSQDFRNEESNSNYRDPSFVTDFLGSHTLNYRATAYWILVW